MTPPRVWHLVTGEYPPASGGVGEYTHALAHALAGEGCRVHVWAPAEPSAERRVEVHPAAFDGEGLRRMSAEMEAFPAPRTLLLQYAPQAFGRRGMNAAFCRWALRRAEAGDDVRVMFHEPYVQFGIRRPQRNVLAAANRWMAMLLLRAARAAYMSTPAWERLLRPWAPRRLGPMRWLPIPSTVPRVDDPEGVAVLRARLGANRPGRHVVGHFGTYGGMIAPLLEPALLAILAPPSTSVALLLGDGGPAFAQRLIAADPALADRVVAPGRLPHDRLSVHLQACDLAIQPYPDGASARRTTVMAMLSHGVPVVTTQGRFTEPEWRAAEIPLLPAGDASALASEALDLLDDAPRRRALGTAGRAFYERSFSMRRTLDVLLWGSDARGERLGKGE
ncbi:glycosyltransferase family 4 protein [Longimicrobium sp.]|uniref:glycosyltransferase family 4 protein n=1 Tax=Longimicrobium sp. TaxID=2029185 RepID=UPI002C207C5B|nr:glycosyltransferase family 4 protein [Longimicrobium sp.]HSU15217.1 glycosyltransferase family 4 protein [Longimicrobium sp.]